jgi:Polyketide cyclase / dehydrase and lipid transport
MPQLLSATHLATTRHSPKRHGATSVVLLLAAQALAGCASIQAIETNNATDTMKVHEVAITRTAVIPGTPEQVFAFIAAEDVLPKVLTGYGPLPAVVRTAEHTGAWDVPGSARLIHLADGSTVREQVTHYAPPGYFAYRVWAFGNPIISALATQARGEWAFAAEAAGTKVTWTYTFTAKNAAFALPLSGITQLLWRGYMDVCLENAQRLMATSQNAT